MTIDDLKTLMDEFEPGTLLPELDTVMGKMELVMRIAVLIGPIVLLILGLAYLFLSPKEANHYIGYRCYYGMGSVQAWRYTQRLAGLLFGGLGLLLTVIMFFVTNGFAGMSVEDMVWKALSCLVWQAILTVIATIAVNVAAFTKFDRNGEFRKKETE